MRITNNMLADTTLRNLNASKERLDRLQNELTSGQRISTPSDDPIGTASALEFRGTLSEVGQYLKNIDSAKSWLGATDTALDSLTLTLQRVRELAVQGANDSLSAGDKQAIATEVSNLIDQAISLGNSTFGGQYLFAGLKVGTAPFTAVGSPPASVTYNGDAFSIVRQINNPATIAVNTPGGASIGPVFTALIDLRDQLTAGNSTGVSASISGIDAALDSVVSSRAQVGARINRLEGEADRLGSLRLDIQGLLSKVQDIDITQAISEFAVQQNVYQAALAAGARAVQPSLLDYLK